MKILFKTRKVQKVCSSPKAMQAKFGVPLAKKLRQRLAELQAARNLHQISRFPPARCHELTGNYKGLLSVDLKHPYRLLLMPAHNPIPTKQDGGLDWHAVTEIVIVAITDTH